MLGVAVIVVLPLKLLRCRATVPEVFFGIVIGLGLAEIEHCTGDGVGVGDEEGVGVGDEEGVGVGDEEGVGVGDEEGVGVGDEEGVGVGDEEGVGVGDGDADGSGVGVGSGITVPPDPLKTTGGSLKS